MTNNKFRWSKVYESTEEELVDFLQSRNIASRRIEAEEADISNEQASDTEITVWCAEGSLVVLQDSAAISLQPGDALRMSAHTPYSLSAGLTGYVCYVSGSTAAA